MSLLGYFVQRWGSGVKLQSWESGDVHYPVVMIGNPEVAYGDAVSYVSVAQGAAGTTQLIAADATKKHKIIGCALVMDAAGTLKFTDGSGDLCGAMSLSATGGFVLPTSPIPYMRTGAINRALNLVTTVGAAKGVVAILTE